MKHTVPEAIRMVGHLLEHNGTTGPFYTNANGQHTTLADPTTCRYCMAGALQAVSQKLGLHYFDLRDVVAQLFDVNSVVILWECNNEYATKASSLEQRLAIARRLQEYGQ